MDKNALGILKSSDWEEMHPVDNVDISRRVIETRQTRYRKGYSAHPPGYSLRPKLKKNNY